MTNYSDGCHLPMVDRKVAIPITFLTMIVGTLSTPPCGPIVPRWSIFWISLSAIALNLLVLSWFVRLTSKVRSGCYFGFMFGALFAAPALENLAIFASTLQTSPIGWQDAPLMLVRAYGDLYQATTSHPTPFRPSPDSFRKLISLTICIGVPEEIVKGLPLLVLMKLRYPRSVNDLWRITSFSALGFGVSESVWYSYFAIPERAQLSQYLGRLIGCSFAHVVFSLLAARLLYFLSTRHVRGPLVLKRILTSFLLASAAVGIGHGVYDWLLVEGNLSLAGVWMSLLSVTVLWLNLLPGLRYSEELRCRPI